MAIIEAFGKMAGGSSDAAKGSLSRRFKHEVGGRYESPKRESAAPPWLRLQLDMYGSSHGHPIISETSTAMDHISK